MRRLFADERVNKRFGDRLDGKFGGSIAGRMDFATYLGNAYPEQVRISLREHRNVVRNRAILMLPAPPIRGLYQRLDLVPARKMPRRNQLIDTIDINVHHAFPSHRSVQRPELTAL